MHKKKKLAKLAKKITAELSRRPSQKELRKQEWIRKLGGGDYELGQKKIAAGLASLPRQYR